MFFVLIVALVRRYLMQGGDVHLSINENPPVIAQLGQKLLSVLTLNKIFLPASCGGKGACGQCRVNITQGNSPLTALEKNFISNQEAEAGDRLACMFVVNGDVSIKISEAAFKSKSYQCRVVSNRLVSTFMTELILKPVNNELFDFEAGDYVLLHAPPSKINFKDFLLAKEYKSSWQEFQFLDLQTEIFELEQRAYSLANAPSETDYIQLLVRIAVPPANVSKRVPSGKVSSYIFSLKTNDIIEISGPFGKFHSRDNDKEMLFIGGGAGMAPLRSIIREKLLYAKTNRKISYWYGARNLPQLCYENEFESLAKEFENFSWHVALSEPDSEDNWQGSVGFIHLIVLSEYLSKHPSPENIDYYICGPPVMSSATITMLKNLSVPEGNIFFDDFGGPG